MKILLFGQPRSRSSYLLDVLCQAYKVDNFFEYYQQAREENQDKTLFKEPNILYKGYKKTVKKYTEKLHERDNFGLKLFPGFVMNYYKVGSRILNSPHHSFTMEDDDFMDLEEYFSISKYDKVFFVYRENIAEAVASFFHGRVVESMIYTGEYGQGMLFTKKDENLINFYKPKGNLYYDNAELKSIVREGISLQILRNRLKRQNIKFLELEYNQIPEYVQTNFPNIQSKYIETKYDYKSNFNNYAKLEYDVQQATIELYNVMKIKDLFSQ